MLDNHKGRGEEIVEFPLKKMFWSWIKWFIVFVFINYIINAWIFYESFGKYLSGDLLWI